MSELDFQHLDAAAVAVLLKAIQALSTCRDLDHVAAVVRTAARQLVQADGATFVILEGERCFYADEDAISPLWKGQRFPAHSCISGWVMFNRKQAIIEDIYQDSRIPHDAYRPTFVKSLVMTPVRIEDPIAAIGTYWACNRVPTENEAMLLQTLAETTAVAVENIRAFDRLEQHGKELEQLVKKRTSELQIANEQLAVARDIAVKESETKSAFVANVSHELRTPLSGIIGMNELLLTMELDEQQRSLAEAVQESGAALLDIINDILDISKIEAGKLDIESSPFNLLYVIQESSRVLSTNAQAKGLRLMTYIDQSVPELVVGDAQRVRQVLLNLIGNAVKATQAGTVTVQALVRSRTERTATIEFIVEDTGSGISERDQEHLFKRFSQISKVSGTGLGLAICQSLVSLMGGKMGCESQLAKGSRFWFVIEFELATSEVPARSSKSEVPTQKAHNDDALVLVVEDNSFLQALVQRQLVELGYPCKVVGTAMEGIDFVKSGNPRMVLMDCSLPDVSGLDATKQIRALEKDARLERLPIVAMTASSMEGDREKCIAVGMDDYLSKPFNLAQLQLKLQQWARPVTRTKAES